MDEVLKELEYVFRAISSIPVTNDSIDTMAVARAKLRNIYAQLKNISKDKEENTDGNGI